MVCVKFTVEPLYSGHHWDHSKCPDFRGFLISGVDFIHICMYLWQNQVSGFEGVQSEGFHCIRKNHTISILYTLFLTDL